MSDSKQSVFVAGLPRAGSTLICQLLGHHPEIYSVRHSSPLCQILEQVRYTLSDNPFFLSQLDVDFDKVNQRLLNFYRGMIRSWFEESDKPVVVDKNRDWLRTVEMLHLLDPEFKMIVCIRDPKQVFGSIESQHRRTRLIDFPDHMAPHSPLARAHALFAEDGVIGGPLRLIQNMQDTEDLEIRSRLCYLSFESLVADPGRVMAFLFEWLQIEPFSIDFKNLSVTQHESDSYYRFKYPHQQFTEINHPDSHNIPERISNYIDEECEWFYQWFNQSEAKEENCDLMR